MGLSNAMPAVCSAIGSHKFSELARVSLLEKKGPANGANVYFRFGLGARPTTIRRSVPARESSVGSAPAQTSSGLDLHDAIVLVSSEQRTRMIAWSADLERLASWVGPDWRAANPTLGDTHFLKFLARLERDASGVINFQHAKHWLGLA